MVVHCNFKGYIVDWMSSAYNMDDGVIRPKLNGGERWFLLHQLRKPRDGEHPKVWADGNIHIDIGGSTLLSPKFCYLGEPGERVWQGFFSDLMNRDLFASTIVRYGGNEERECRQINGLVMAWMDKWNIDPCHYETIQKRVNRERKRLGALGLI